MIPKPNKTLDDLTSYRPISLTSCLSKLLERLILNKINTHLTQNEIIPPNQAGFRQNFSINDNMLRLINGTINNFNDNKITGLVMFDVERAFDRVWHDGLFYKLKQIRLPHYLILWLNSFIKGMCFKV